MMIGIVVVAPLAASRRPGSNQHPDAGADQLLHNSGQLLGSLLGPAVENRDGAAVGPTERGESLTERIEKPLVVLPKAGLDKADARHLGLGRGRVPIDRRSRREQHERAAVHSIAQAETVRLTAGQPFF